jgi:serine/threonine-protein kinase
MRARDGVPTISNIPPTSLCTRKASVSNNTPPVVLNERYELSQRIGRGGMADVFLARDQLLNRQVAIKVLFPEFATDPNFVERFRREAQSAANLNHPNIVGVYDWGKYANTYFMAMEYVQGRTLADILRANGHINSVQAAEIASEISAALGHAHRNGVAHRDIKPANILIGSNGQVKVADFGIARAMNAPTESNLTQVGNVMGTATYFSPEQAQGAQPDPRSDLYSLGVVLYEMVAGRPPFSGDNPVAIAYKQVHDQPQPLNQLVADVPRAYEAIVAKLLAKQPAMRYASADELREDLRRFRAGEPVAALGPTAPSPGAPAATTAMPTAPPPLATTAMPRTTAMPGQYGPGPGLAPTPAGGRTTMVPPQHVQPDDERSRGTWYAVAGFVALLVLVAGGLVLFNALNKQDKAETPEFVNVPALVGVPLEDATKQLEELGLTFKTEADPEAVEVQEGQVARTDPLEGVLVQRGDPVTLFFRPISQPVPIPDVTNLTEADARLLLEGEGFIVGRVDVENDPAFEEGTVIRTDPPAGELHEQGTTVNVVLSGGPDQVAVPNVIGQAEANATQLLQGEPFLFVVTVVNEASATVPAGSVIRTDPAVDQLLAKGAPVTLVVSSGKEKRVVPLVVGKDQATATALIQGNDLVVEVSFQPVAQGGPQDGRVISVSPGEGTEVEIGSTVKIKVGQGVAPPTTSTSTTTTTTTTTAPPPTDPPPST